MPVLFIWAQGERRRLVIGKGIELEIWEIDAFNCSWDLLRVNGGLNKAGADILAGKCAVKTKGYDDITGISSQRDDLLISRVSGRIQRIRFVAPEYGRPARIIELARYEAAGGTIQSLTSHNNLMIAASSTRPISQSPATSSHSISIFNISSPWISPTHLSLPTKPWSTLTTPSSIIVGSSGPNPLRIYPLSPSGSTHSPSDYISPSSTSIYALCTPPLSISYHFHSSAIVLAACFDSLTRVYDIRLPSTQGPVMTLGDPFSDDACYSVSMTGSWVAVGTARNASIRLFDLRNAREDVATGGITLFGQRKERSPVYGVALAFSRIYAVTDRRGFVVDFDCATRGNGEPVGYYKHLGEGAGEFQKSGGGSW